jgi:hypothetical protein
MNPAARPRGGGVVGCSICGTLMCGTSAICRGPLDSGRPPTVVTPSALCGVAWLIGTPVLCAEPSDATPMAVLPAPVPPETVATAE